MTTSLEKEFFEGKRPWSKVKDEILRKYLVPYLAKVNKLGKPIILIDGFAGPGKYDDGSVGSPILINEIATERVGSNYLSLLVNKNKEHHKSLTEHLSDFIAKGTAIPIRGTAEELLTQLNNILDDQTVFIYLDPFGLRGCEFKVLRPFLKRSNIHSTEIVVNLSVPILYRLAAREAYKKDPENPRILKWHETLSQALGGDYWKKFLLNETLESEKQVRKLIKSYTNILKKDLPYVGYCPIHESTEKSRIKYYVVFASRHIDATLLMNDIMFEAYNEFIWNNTVKNTLFEVTDWEDEYFRMCSSELKALIINELALSKLNRKTLWEKIVIKSFMKFSKKHFRRAVKELYENDIIDFIDIRGTGNINEESLFFLKPNYG